MMIAAGIFAALTLFGVAIYGALFGFAALAEPPQGSSGASPDDTIGFVVLITMMIVFGLVMTVLYGLVGWGGWNMMNRRSYAFALTGSVLCIVLGIPCSCIPINSLVFIPIGIWSLTVLLDQTVKDNWFTPEVPVYVPPGSPPFIPPSS